jgi:hypothetical protein
MSNRHHSPGLGRWIEVVETPVGGAPAKARRRQQEEPFARRRKPGFIILPADWIEALKQVAPHPPWGVALYLVQKFIRSRDGNGKRVRTIVASNKTLKDWRIGADAKVRDLRIIETVGLIKIEPLKPGQSPRVTWLVDPEG